MISFLSVRLAAREGRSGVRRIGIFLLAVALGVGTLTGLHGFREDAVEGVRAESRALMGADLRLESGVPFTDEAEAVLDSLRGEGLGVARGVLLATSVPSPTGPRLVQLHAVEDGFPLVGGPQVEGGGAWGEVFEGPVMAAPSATLRQLDLEAGDALRLGQLEVRVLGAVEGLPVEVGPQGLLGPPIYLSLASLEGTGLLGFGSLARFRALVTVPSGTAPEGEARSLRERLGGEGVTVQTARAEAETLARGFRSLAGFLGLVGLMALLLGGIGVASAVHVHVRERMTSIAVLRCLGARQGTVFRVYLLQALALGLGGALLGIVLGVGLQFGMASVFSGILPFEPNPRLRPTTLAAGLLTGTWVAFLFALFPLLRVREVPPLAALRSEVDPAARGGALLRAGTGLLLLLTLFLLSAVQVGGALPGAVLALALAGVLGVLALLSHILVRLARGLLPPGAPFRVRQGVAGLFRPGNQTLAVLVSLGFGAFLLGSLLVAEAGLRSSLLLDPGGGQPALVLLDIQSDQQEAVTTLVEASGVPFTLVPLVPSRLHEIRDIPVDSLMEAGTLSGWVGRRVYRNTWREGPSPTEVVVAGSWEREGDGAAVREAVEAGAVRVSLEVEIAGELGVGVGDRVTWDVQGRLVPSVVTSLREVDWASLSPNFYAVFEPADLEGAPTTWVGLVPQLPGPEVMALQDRILVELPNVSILDVSAVLETVERVSGRVVAVLRTMAGVATFGGFLVLLAALLTGRFRRRRESALLKTLGARRPVIRGVLLVEYAVLGGVGTTAGLLLGAVGGSVLLSRFLQVSPVVPWDTLALTWAGLVLLTVAAGWSVSRPVLREPPLVMLRQEV